MDEERRGIEVVTGILVRHGRLLLQQRRADDRHAPRELWEELRLWVGPLPETSYWCGSCGQDGNRGGVNVFLIAYCVPDGSPAIGDPSPQEGQGWGWFTRAQLLALRGSLNYGNELMLDRLASLPGLAESSRG